MLLLGAVLTWLNVFPPRVLGQIMAFGAGELFSPEAFEHGGKLTGVVTVLGFTLARALAALE